MRYAFLGITAISLESSNILSFKLDLMITNNRMTFFVSSQPAFGSNILKAQLYPKAKLLSEMGWECQFIGADITERCIPKNKEILYLQYGFRDIKVFAVYPKMSNWFSLSAMRTVLKNYVFNSLTEWKPSWVYFRSTFDFLMCYKMLQHIESRCVYDVRAALSDEVYRKQGGFIGQIKKHIVLYKEKKVFKRADHLLCVSQAMKQWVSMLSGRIDIEVIPSCVDQKVFRRNEYARLKWREELGWSKKSPVIVYAGGLSYWQRIGDIIEVVRQIKNKVADLKVLVLTKHVENISEMFAAVEFPFDDLHIESVPHDKMPNWLSVADVGIILRHDILTNNVASPIKIGEYLSIGLPVICTKGIGDYSDAILHFNAGVVLDDELFDERIVSLLTNEEKLKKCRQNALRLSDCYSKSLEREKLLSLLNKLSLPDE